MQLQTQDEQKQPYGSDTYEVIVEGAQGAFSLMG